MRGIFDQEQCLGMAKEDDLEAEEDHFIVSCHVHHHRPLLCSSIFPSYCSPISTRPTNPKPNSHIFFTNRNQSSKGRRRTVLITNATANQNDKDKDQDSDSPGFNPFGFVTDNPSSRSAIQLPESPAEAGNVGQMLNVSSALFCA